MAYNVTPAPTSGNGAYGLVPGQTALPPSIYSESIGAMPGLAGLGTQASGVIGSELSGTLSPGTLGTLQDKAAAFGVGAGTPFTSGTGTGSLPMSDYLESVGLSSQTLANQGVGNYNSFLGSIGSQQLDPALQASISQSNAVLGSAPSPQAAVSAEQSWLQQYQQMMNPATGTSSFSSTGNSGPNLASMGNFLNPSGYQSQGYADPANPGGTDPYSVFTTGGSGGSYGGNFNMFA